jgi:adenylosuccinate synthase
MAHKIDMVIDLQFGSTGKGLLAGYLAKRGGYDTVVCSFATNAGHTYIDKERGIEMMTQQLPTGISSLTVKNVLIGPGSLIHVQTLLEEVTRYADMLQGKRIMIHPHAAVVTDEHAEIEKSGGMSKIGSTTKGVGAAMVQRIQRNPENMNIAKNFLALASMVVSDEEYRDAIENSENLLVEGAQGFSLSMYHGFYPYCTSRDVTPWQIAADCGLPFKMAPYIQIWGTLRTYPIRVNNRDGNSGPGYNDQIELDWEDFGITPEKTTVTKLPRRIFSFSIEQLRQAVWHCGQYWHTNLFLNFANYNGDEQDITAELIKEIEKPRPGVANFPKVTLIGFGADEADIMTRPDFDKMIAEQKAVGRYPTSDEGNTPE